MTSHRIASLAQLDEAGPCRVEVDGRTLCLVRSGEVIHALDDRCTHAEASLSEGDLDLEEGTLECPLHGSPFRLADGVPVSLPATRPVATYPVTIDGDDVLVEIED